MIMKYLDKKVWKLLLATNPVQGREAAVLAFNQWRCVVNTGLLEV